MKGYQLRVVEEEKELISKIAKLKKFITDNEELQFDGLPETERQLLRKQMDAMLNYWNVLGERMKFWTEQDPHWREIGEN